MKRILYLLLIFIFMLSGCGNSDYSKNESHTQVVINMPSDDTVNGYRTDSASVPNSQPEIYTSSAVTDAAPAATNSITTTESFCGNKSSKVFHLSTCGSVSNMKEENKVYLSSRDEYISQGYTPCKRCSP